MKNQQPLDSVSRLRRIIAILVLLQTKRIVTANEFADRFLVSTRTIYRDIRLLEQAGVPVVTEEGKGFTLMEGYKLPPFLFTENEANAIVTAEKFISANGDTSLVKNFGDAVSKIKAVLRYTEKDKIELLSSRIKIYPEKETDKTSSQLSALQLALTTYSLVRLRYRSIKSDTVTDRIVEPFALFYAANGWLLVAFCRLRNDYRIFRLDRFVSFQVVDEKFEAHTLTIAKYLNRFSNEEIHP